MIKIDGIVVPGFQIASGNNEDTPFGHSTIALQKPYFEQLGLNLNNMFNGTINLQATKYKSIKLTKPTYCFKRVQWIDGFSAEDFAFIPIEILFNNKRYNGFIYQPLKESKIGHFQPSNVLEILAPFIPDLSYQDSISIELDPNSVDLIINN